jgi:hypothetical protein
LYQTITQTTTIPEQTPTGCWSDKNQKKLNEIKQMEEVINTLFEEQEFSRNKHEAVHMGQQDSNFNLLYQGNEYKLNYTYFKIQDLMGD